MSVTENATGEWMGWGPANTNKFVYGTRSGTFAIENNGGSQAHNNIQPYITCYMWKRVG